MSLNMSTIGRNICSSSGSTPNSPREVEYYGPSETRTHIKEINGHSFVTKTKLIEDSDMRTHTWFDEYGNPKTIVKEKIN